MDNVDYDVVIIGAGPAGTCAALALQQRGIEHILLLERTDTALKDTDAAGESLSPDGVRQLQALGINCDTPFWLSQGHLPHYAMTSLWGSRQPLCEDFFLRGQGHSWHLRRPQFNQQLRRHCCQNANTHLLDATSVVGMTRDQEQRWLIQCQRDSALFGVRTKALIDASGRHASAVRRLGIERHASDKLVAIGCTAGPMTQAGVGLIEAVAHGWWYAAPISAQASTVMLFTDGDLLNDTGLRDPAVFLETWNQTELLRASITPPVVIQGELSVRPAISAHLRYAGGPGWIAVGDALMSFDPLSASGITGAISDSIQAADVVVAWLRKHDGFENTAQMSGAHWQNISRQYAERAQQSWQHFRQQQIQWYQREQRFAQFPFWRRRHDNHLIMTSSATPMQTP